MGMDRVQKGNEDECRSGGNTFGFSCKSTMSMGTQLITFCMSLFLPSMLSNSLKAPDVPSSIKEKPRYFCNYSNKTSSFA